MAVCPSCTDQPLNHTLLADGLAGLGCRRCQGTLLSLVTYRRWQEKAPPGVPRSNAAFTAAESTDALHCPKCRALMTKYRISSDVSNRVDYCAHCEEIWLDRGEWSLVEAFARSGELAGIVTQPWQRRIREARTADLREERLREALGEDFERFRQFRDWLRKHPARDEILAQLHLRER